MTCPNKRSAGVESGTLMKVAARCGWLAFMLAWFAALAAAAPPDAPERDERFAERDRLRAQSQELQTRGKGAEAMKNARDALAISKSLFPAIPGETLVDWALIGNAAQQMVDWQTAIDARNEALRICTEVAGKTHWITTDLRVEAEKTARLRDLSADDRRSIDEAIKDQPRIRQLFETSQYAQALEIADRCRRLYERLWGAEHAETASAWNDVGTIRQAQGDYPASQSAFERASTIREKALGPEHPLTAGSLSNLALVFNDQGKYADAENLFLRARKIMEKAVGPNDARSLTVANNLAMVYVKRGELMKADALFREVLKYFPQIFGEEHPFIADVLNNLASACQNQGKDAEAEQMMRRALAIRQKSFGQRHPKTATSLNNLALLYSRQGKYAQAEPLFKRALEVFESVGGKDHPHVATILDSLAAVYGSQGNYAEAERLLSRALEIRAKTLGPDHPDIAAILGNIGLLYHNHGDDATALKLFERVRETLEKSTTLEHPEAAKLLGNLAMIYRRQRRFAEAEALYKRALAIQEKMLGPEHRDLVATLNNIAFLYKAQADDAAAESHYTRALAIAEKSLGAEHPMTADVLINLGILRWRTAGGAAARPLVARALNMQMALIERTAAIETEEEQLAMKAQAAGSKNLWLTVTADDRQSDADSWRYALLWKGLATSRQSRLGRILKDEPGYVRFREVSQQLSAVTLHPPQPPEERRALADWQARAPGLRRAWQERKDGLEAEYQLLQRELSQKFDAFRQTVTMERDPAEAAGAALSRMNGSAALVDVIQYGYGSGEKAEWRFAAFVILANHGVRRIELGASEPIEQAIGAWRERLQRQQDAAEEGARLRRLLWAPLAAELRGIDTVFISPDGMTAQVPWGALPGDKLGTYLLEERTLAIIPAPQSLSELVEREPYASPPSLLLIGDIDYAGRPSVVNDSLAQRSAVGRSGEALKFNRLAAAASELASIEHRFHDRFVEGKVEILNGATATESAVRARSGAYDWLHVATHGYFAPETIRSAIQDASDEGFRGKNGTSSADVSSGDRSSAGIGAALEVSAGRCFVMLLVSGGAAERDNRLKAGDEIVAVASGEEWTPTAGKSVNDVAALIRGPVETIVRLKVRPKENPAQEIELALKRANIPGIASNNQPFVHPGLLSGLAFAGANLPPEEGKDDGILTALEVSALDLSKVDTVVLSACETGLGEVAGGEGLLGLQRAFQVAGAKTVVASLWKIPDGATSALMQRFYENLWEKKMGKLAALRDAQIWMLREVPKDAKLRSAATRGLNLPDAEPEISITEMPPYFWAAFVLSGDWR